MMKLWSSLRRGRYGKSIYDINEVNVEDEPERPRANTEAVPVDPKEFFYAWEDRF